jgi:HAD superfamily hydrolase (TIGR01549 family)
MQAEAMTVRAVVFDIGGVLERTVPADGLVARWCGLLGMDEPALRAALRTVDPDGVTETGGMSETVYMRRYADALGLDPDQAARWARELWDWYCGEPDSDLIAWAAGLRPRLRTGILSNSADGARREEQARYGFEDLVDEIVYSHELGIAKPDPRAYQAVCDRLSVRPDEAVFLDDNEGPVEGARAVGMHAILHTDTRASIAAIEALLSPR